MIWNKEMECADREVMRDLQLKRLQEEVKYEYEHVPYYAEKMGLDLAVTAKTGEGMVYVSIDGKDAGTVIGKRAMIYPTSCVRGIVPSDTIVKNTGEMIAKRED